MKLSAYTELIKNLPYKDQAFETSKETWNRKEFKKNEYFHSFYESTFKDVHSVTLSRRDLFEKVNGADFFDSIFSIILWGYPKGYTRPHTASNLFPKFLSGGLNKLKTELYPNKKYSIVELKKVLSDIDGVGISTLTKFLYFFNCSIEGNQCLILDNKIMEVLKNGKFDEFNGFKISSKKEEVYTTYLNLMKGISEDNGFLIDRLELFLFMFGKNLKSE